LIVGGLGAVLIGALIEDQLRSIWSEDPEFEASLIRRKEDVLLIDLLGCGVGQLVGEAGGELHVAEAGFDFDVACHGAFTKVKSGRSVNLLLSD
jgi:hypothetical protein